MAKVVQDVLCEEIKLYKGEALKKESKAGN
jgi:hypothetical protein